RSTGKAARGQPGEGLQKGARVRAQAAIQGGSAMRSKLLSVLAGAALAWNALAAQAAAQTKEITFWSHWAAEMPKRTFVEKVIADFEAKNPDIKIKATWYEKTALYAALKTALRAGQAPDVFYAEPDQVEYMDSGFLLDLSELNWAAVEPWAKEAWMYKG